MPWVHISIFSCLKIGNLGNYKSWSFSRHLMYFKVLLDVKNQAAIMLNSCREKTFNIITDTIVKKFVFFTFYTIKMNNSFLSFARSKTPLCILYTSFPFSIFISSSLLIEAQPVEEKLIGVTVERTDPMIKDLRSLDI